MTWPFDVRTDLITQGARGDCEGDLHAHESADDGDVTNHPELDYVGAEFGIDDAGEHVSHLTALTGRAHRSGARTLLSTACGRFGSAHGIIEPNGAVAGGLLGVVPKVRAKGDYR